MSTDLAPPAPPDEERAITYAFTSDTGRVFTVRGRTTRCGLRKARPAVATFRKLMSVAHTRPSSATKEAARQAWRAAVAQLAQLGVTLRYICCGRPAPRRAVYLYFVLFDSGVVDNDAAGAHHTVGGTPVSRLVLSAELTAELMDGPPASASGSDEWDAYFAAW